MFTCFANSLAVITASLSKFVGSERALLFVLFDFVQTLTAPPLEKKIITVSFPSFFRASKFLINVILGPTFGNVLLFLPFPATGNCLCQSHFLKLKEKDDLLEVLQTRYGMEMNISQNDSY